MILIISGENDTSADEICKWLIYFEKKFIRLSESNFMTKIKIDISKNIYEIEIDNSILIDINLIKSVFYSGGDFNYQLKMKKEVDKFLSDYYLNEWSVLKDYLKYKISIGSIKLIGNLYKNKINKLKVLHLAKEVGLNIPKTYIISTKKDLLALFENEKMKFITKSISEMKPSFKDESLWLNYTKKLDKNENYADCFIPSLVQEMVEKKYEIRTFFIGKEFWSIAIFSQENVETVIDSRVNSFSHSTLFKLPPTLEKKVARLVKNLNLNSGSIDWIYSKKGKFYFLEINPAGIFSNVSVVGNYNIEMEIAKRV